MLMHLARVESLAFNVHEDLKGLRFLFSPKVLLSLLHNIQLCILEEFRVEKTQLLLESFILQNLRPPNQCLYSLNSSLWDFVDCHNF